MVEDAISYYEKAIEFDHMYVSAYFNLGIALQSTGDFEGAIKNYRKVINLEPEHSIANEQLVILLFESGRESEAFDVLNLALQANPSDTHLVNAKRQTTK